jgi:Helix-turn-helix domain
MSTHVVSNEYHVPPLRIEQIAQEVAVILTGRLSAKDIVKLLQVIFLEVDEAAEMLRVEPRTIRSWVYQDRIPYRRANGKLIFLLSELLEWTLPENDKHTAHRLPIALHGKITASQLAATWERKQ